MKNLLELISETCNVPIGKITGKDRTRHVVIARHLYCYIMREYYKSSLLTIARSINKDHTTVIYCLRQIKDLLDIKDETICKQYGLIMDKIKDESKSEIKLHIYFHDLTDPNLLISEILKKYNCTIALIY